jgi:hypothetical protein
MDNKVDVYDNFLSTHEFEGLKSTLLGGNFPWFLHKVVDPEHHALSEDVAKYNFQFSHVFYNNYAPHSEYFQNVTPIVDKLNPLSVLRVKANLTTRTEKIVEQGYHTDYPDNTKCITGVFYVNTTDGYTKFLNGEVIESVENRLVLFDSQMKHTGTTSTDSDVRCVINFNIIPRV